MNPNINQNVQLMDILGQLTDRVMGPKNNPTFLGGVAQGLYESPGHMMGMVEGMRDIGLGRARPQYGPTLMGLGEQMGGYQVPDQGPASIGRAMGRNMLSIGAGVGEYIRQQGGGGLAQFAGELAGDTFTGNPRALAAIPILLRGVPDVIRGSAIKTSQGMVTGADHYDAITKALKSGALSDITDAKNWDELFESGESIMDQIDARSGFYTDSGEFLTRNEAGRLAGTRSGEATSEDLDAISRQYQDNEWGLTSDMVRYNPDMEVPGVNDIEIDEFNVLRSSDSPDGNGFVYRGDNGEVYSIVDHSRVGDADEGMQRYSIYRGYDQDPEILDGADTLEEAQEILREYYDTDIQDEFWLGDDLVPSGRSPGELEDYFVDQYIRGSSSSAPINASNTPHYSEVYDAQVESPDFEIIEAGTPDNTREWFIELLRDRPDGYDEPGYLIYDDADNVVGWAPDKKGAKRLIDRVSRR